MKRKSLLLIIPFAAAALVGCSPSTVPCEQAQISFSEGSVNLTVGSEKELNYSIEGGACSGELKFEVADTSIAEVIQKDGKYYVKGKKVGDTTITCNGKTIKVYVSNGEDPEPTKEVSKVTGLDKVTAPQIKVGDEFKAEWVSLKVEYTDGETGTVVADRVEISTEVAGEAISGTAYYKEFEGVTFTIKVVQEYTADYGTEDNPVSVSQALITMGIDCKSDNQLTKQAIYCIGTVKQITNVYHYQGDIGSDCYELVLTDGTNDVIVFRLHSTDDLKDQVAEGNEIKICGYGKNFKGTLEFVDNGATKCILLDNGTPTPEKEVTGITAVSYTKTLYVGETINPQDVTLTVTYSDTTSGSVKAQSVDGYSTASAGNTTATAHYGTFTKDFVVEVKDAPVAEELTPAQVIALCDEAGSGVVVDHEVIVVGVANDSDFNSNYKQWSGKFEGSKLTFDSAGTNETYDTLDGKTIKVKGYPELYNGTYKIGYLPPNVSPTGAKYNPTLLSVSEPVQKEVKSIEISGTPTKTSYYVGESYSAAGLSVVATYTDDTTSTVSATISPDKEKAALGDTIVTFSATYDGKTATKDVTVSVGEKPAPASVNVEYELKTGVSTDASADITEAKLKEIFANSLVEGEDILSSASDIAKVYEGADNSLKFSSNKANGSVTLGLSKNVTTVVVKGVAISDTAALTVNGSTESFTSESATYEFVVSSTKSVTLAAENKLRITYIGFAAEGVQPAKQITGVELQGTLAKNSYVEGQTFDPSGLSLKVTYNEGDPDVLTSGFTFNVTNPLAVGEYDLKATYQGHTTEDSVHISVVALAITALEIKSGMTKTAYVLEEAWAPAGIVVEATYNDGSKANLQSGDYTLEFDPIEPALDTEEVSIVAKVANRITSAAYTQKVSVTEEKVEATLTGIEASGYTKTATVGQTYTFDGIVTASYSDGSSHEVTGYTWTTAISTASAGEKTGVISYTEGDETKTCDVVVTVAEAHENTVKTAYEAAIPMTGSDDAHKETDEMTFEGVVSAIQGNSFVVADGDYGILVYNYAVSGIDVGKTITVKATLKNYKGLIETSSTKSATLGAAGTVPTPVNVTSVTQLDGLKTNVLVNCARLEVVSKETAWASNKTSNWVVKLNGSSVTLSLNQYVFDSAKSSFIKGLNVGDVFSASNLTVGCYNNINQFSVMRDTTFQAAPAKEIASLGEVTAPASIGKGGTLSVSDVSVAVTYDDTTTGSVHPDRIELDTSAVADSVTGTVYVGDLSATFTIAVTEKPVSTETTITKSIKDISGTTSDGTQVSNMTMDAVISLVASDSGNNGKVYGSGTEWRLYHSDSGTMTVNAVSGYTIVSIKITYTNAKNGYLTYDSSKVSSDDVVEINATSACFIVDGGETGKTNGQVKVSSITVVYKAN